MVPLQSEKARLIWRCDCSRLRYIDVGLERAKSEASYMRKIGEVPRRFDNAGIRLNFEAFAVRHQPIRDWLRQNVLIGYDCYCGEQPNRSIQF